MNDKAIALYVQLSPLNFQPSFGGHFFLNSCINSHQPEFLHNVICTFWLLTLHRRFSPQYSLWMSFLPSVSSGFEPRLLRYIQCWYWLPVDRYHRHPAWKLHTKGKSKERFCHAWTWHICGQHRVTFYRKKWGVYGYQNKLIWSYWTLQVCSFAEFFRLQHRTQWDWSPIVPLDVNHVCEIWVYGEL